MNRNLVKRNLRSSIFVTTVGVVAFSAAFVVALAWVG